ncbi:hypothetical protein B0I33_104515 [Prauserella shujinwangii]|uniref:Uncharacterized protein n=1 Tax=Prauserella shujinwangii TaxID=1453103 RepID=A0A2T0LXH1_9PSEU|nr:hypothetical protein [Prauserella shujinwangii]PRX48697.1 hypothetical protein B0I33_104515 [Prauserella shujinwangii]
MSTEAIALDRLAVLREAGWQFLPVIDEGGELTELRGVRAWPTGHADALLVRDATDAAGLRCDANGGVVWQREGGLPEVIDGLLTLPPPDAPGAPRLVRGRAPNGLWVP